MKKMIYKYLYIQLSKPDISIRNSGSLLCVCLHGVFIVIIFVFTVKQTKPYLYCLNLVLVADNFIHSL